MQSLNLEPIYGMVVLVTALRMLKRIVTVGVAASANLLDRFSFHESKKLGPCNERDFDVDSRALCAQCESALTEASDFVEIPKWG